jgi:hypothetical protein
LYRGLTSVGSKALKIVKLPKSPSATVSMLNVMYESLSKEVKKPTKEDRLTEIN